MADKTPADPRKKKLTQEEEYFAQEEMKKRAALREKLNQERQQAAKQQAKETHWMKCPKCGHDLVEKKHADVLIDQCSVCHGVWLDPGELDLLLGDHSLAKHLGDSVRKLIK